MSTVTLVNSKWKDVKSVIDKVHKHVCGHASHNDLKMLLERNRLWNEAIASYVRNLIEGCSACRATYFLQPNRKVSISSLSNNFNEVVCIDHLFLEDNCLLHCMDLVKRYSAALFVETTVLKEAIIGFEAFWISQFWYLDAIRADLAFHKGESKANSDRLGIPLQRVPTRRHSKDAIDSKHNIIHSIFIRLKEAAGSEFDPALASYQAVTISNDLYGNDTVSSFELEKGFTHPITSKPLDLTVPHDLRQAGDELQARRKLALILKSKDVPEVPFSVCSIVEIYQKHDNEKRGKWYEAKTIRSLDKHARVIKVPGKNGG